MLCIDDFIIFNAYARAIKTRGHRIWYLRGKVVVVDVDDDDMLRTKQISYILVQAGHLLLIVVGGEGGVSEEEEKKESGSFVQ